MNIAEELKITSGIIPVNLATAANPGDWFSMKNFGHVDIVVFKGAGTAGEDPILTLQQATAVAGTSAKALDFYTIYEKVGAQTGLDVFTKVQDSSIPRSAAAENTYLNLVSAEAEGIFVIPIDASRLDVAGGFDCIQLSIADVGTNAQTGGVLYIGSVPRIGGDAAAITD